MNPTGASSRLPLFLLSGSMAFGMLLSLVQSALWSNSIRARPGHALYRTLLDGASVLEHVWVLCALVMLVRLPRTEVWVTRQGASDAPTVPVGLRAPAIVAAVVAFMELLRSALWIGAVRTAMGRSGHLQTWVIATAVPQAILYLVGMSLCAFIGWRILAAAGRRPATALAVAAQSLAVMCFGHHIWSVLIGWNPTSPVAYILWYFSSYGSNIGVIALLVWAGRVTRRQPVAERADTSVDSAPLSLLPGWRAMARGIDLYLFALVARIVFAGATYVTMLGAKNAMLHGGLGEVQTTVTVMLGLGLVASAATMRSVFQMAEAPQPEVATAANAALGFMALAFLIECTVAWLTTDALSGSLAAAFRAARVLPILSAVGAALGLAASTFLLTALAHAARALKLTTAAVRATDARRLLLFGGAATAGALLLAKPLPELALAVAVVALPLLLIAAIQLLRVMLEISRTIREHEGDSEGAMSSKRPDSGIEL